MKNLMLCGLVLTIISGCERGLSEDTVYATFPNNGDIFIDNPVSLTDEFFISFDPAAGANTNGFGTDETVVFEGTSSIRIDVPRFDDPEGGFIGGIFKDRGVGRNLTQYDALTFYAKASTTATIGVFGFGDDFEDNRFAVTLDNTVLSTDWKKIIIPIPDASKLIQESGMFLFSAGSQSTGGAGYTFWIDELRFETLGTIGQSRPQILGGVDGDFFAIPGQLFQISGLSHTFDVNGSDVTVGLGPSYFEFESSDPTVAAVSDSGEVVVFDIGNADITARINDVQASGSLKVDSADEVRIISLFSDLYANVPVSRFNSFFEPFQETLGGVVQENGGNIIRYTNLNFVGIVFNDVIFPEEAVPTVDATDMTNFNIDIRVDENVDPGDFIEIEFTDYAGGGAGRVTIDSSQLVANEWVSLNIPLDSFGLASRSALGLLLFQSGEFNTNISNIPLDNIFFSREE